MSPSASSRLKKKYWKLPENYQPGAIRRQSVVNSVRRVNIGHVAGRDVGNASSSGQSEGGNAVAEYSGENAFAGYIVTGWDCRHGLYPSGPVLAIRGARDSIANRGRCNVGFTKHSESIIVPNAGHNVSGFPETVAALQSFLAAVAPRE